MFNQGTETVGKTGRAIAFGALLGAGAGLAVALYSQLRPRWQLPDGFVFSGAPQGFDQYTYFAIVRAIWRSPAGLTYGYPFAAEWEMPPVVFQVTFAVLALLARITGIPAAFELFRVAGAAATGAAVAALGCRLFPRAFTRRFFYVAAVLCGGWLWTAGVFQALQEHAFTSERVAYATMERAGPIYLWLPYLAQNLKYPLECVYHALVLGALGCLLSRCHGCALALGAVAWFSNPFPAIALTAAVVPWYASMALSRFSRRRETWENPESVEARNCLISWLGVALLSFLYYALFLGRWPVMAELSRLLRGPFSDTLPPGTFVLMGGPWLAGLIWSFAHPAGRRHVWRKPVWRLFALLAMSQIALLYHHLIAGNQAMQPFHYNRGYLHVALVVLFFRMCDVWATPRAPAPGGEEGSEAGVGAGSRTGTGEGVVSRRVRTAVILALLSTLPEQAVFVRLQLALPLKGLVPVPLMAMIDRLNTTVPGRALVYVEPVEGGSELGALSDHQPYLTQHSYYIPFRIRRFRAVRDAGQGDDAGLRKAGVAYVIAYENRNLRASLAKNGWTSQFASGELVLLKAPAKRGAMDGMD